MSQLPQLPAYTRACLGTSTERHVDGQRFSVPVPPPLRRVRRGRSVDASGPAEPFRSEPEAADLAASLLAPRQPLDRHRESLGVGPLPRAPGLRATERPNPRAPVTRCLRRTVGNEDWMASVLGIDVQGATGIEAAPRARRKRPPSGPRLIDASRIVARSSAGTRGVRSRWSTASALPIRSPRERSPELAARADGLEPKRRPSTDTQQLRRRGEARFALMPDGIM
mgnify:CR=1 FL=1